MKKISLLIGHLSFSERHKIFLRTATNQSIAKKPWKKFGLLIGLLSGEKIENSNQQIFFETDLTIKISIKKTTTFRPLNSHFQVEG